MAALQIKGADYGKSIATDATKKSFLYQLLAWGY
jgi:hypothetical protein